MLTIDRVSALQFLNGDQALLDRILALFQETIAQLHASLDEFIRAQDTEAESPSWRALYQSLHGAKPVFLIVGSAQVRAQITEFHNALVALDAGRVLALAPAMESMLGSMLREIQAPQALDPR